MDILDSQYGLSNKVQNISALYNMPVGQYERYSSENMPWTISSFTLNLKICLYLLVAKLE